MCLVYSAEFKGPLTECYLLAHALINNAVFHKKNSFSMGNQYNLGKNIATHSFCGFLLFPENYEFYKNVNLS